MKRLETILSMIPQGSRLVDVGCDHCYIPIQAVSTGLCPEAYASDVRPGPLGRARENVRAAGLSGKITLAQADGLHGAEAFDPDAVVIAGMGGELIAGIIDAAPFVRSPRVSLILQPMTSPYELRKYLFTHGFGAVRERLAAEDGHIYQIISCRYTGISPIYTEAELEVGRDHGDAELAAAHLEKYIKKYDKIIKGIAASGKDAEAQIRVRGELIEKYENQKAVRRT